MKDACKEGGAWFAFDYDTIRPAGAAIRGFGGTASGPDPLKTLHRRIESRFCSNDTCEL
ncbi:MAG: hypothetical protein IE886_00190 [Campylobacterales bacterium]|nr:hypothetical protein [Campylobacterales bacterium]